MEVKKTLEMDFKDQAQRKYTLRVDSPREDLDEAEVSGAMDVLLNAGVFSNRGIDLEEKDGARIVTTTSEELI